MRSALLITIAATSLMTAAAGHAQTPQALQSQQGSERAHEKRLAVDAHAIEISREHLHQELAAAQKSGNAAAIAKAQAGLKHIYAQEKDDKAMETKDAAEDKKLGIKPPSSR